MARCGRELIELIMRIGETEHVAKIPGFGIEGNPNDYCLQGSSVSPPRQKNMARPGQAGCGEVKYG